MVTFKVDYVGSLGLMSAFLFSVIAGFELGKTLKNMLGVLEEYAGYLIERLL